MLTYLCEVGFFGWDRQNFGQYPNLIGRALREAYKQFNQWKKDNRIAVSQPRFTAARLSRTQRTSYPCLSSKAAASKAISFWLLSCAIEHGRSPEASDLDKHVANCIWTYAEVLRLLDESCFKQKCSVFFHTGLLLHVPIPGDFSEELPPSINSE